jgi:uncharacterized SAM-binding protein YcdF (DUF218 family)
MAATDASPGSDAEPLARSQGKPSKASPPGKAERRLRRRRRLRRFGAVAGGLAAAWLAGLLWFAGTIPREPPLPGSAEAERHTDAIVVLTGGSERLQVGLDLLAAGRAGKLFVSGVYHSVDVRELLRLSSQKPHQLECCIVLGYAADNTVGNAAETAAWMRAEHFTSLRLVTANYHLRRSLLEFHMAIPEAEIISHPVVPANVRVADWWLWRRTTSLIVTEYNKYLVALGRHAVAALLGPLG